MRYPTDKGKESVAAGMLDRTWLCLPASFLNTRDLTCKGHVAEHVTAKAKMAHITSWTTAQLAPVVQANGRSISRNFVKCCVIACSFKLSAFFSKLFN
jgi:hypothetical protein